MEDGRKKLSMKTEFCWCVEQDDAVGRGKTTAVEQVTFETGGYVILGTIYGTRKLSTSPDIYECREISDTDC